jgi:hypothetical protein
MASRRVRGKMTFVYRGFLTCEAQETVSVPLEEAVGAPFERSSLNLPSSLISSPTPLRCSQPPARCGLRSHRSYNAGNCLSLPLFGASQPFFGPALSGVEAAVCLSIRLRLDARATLCIMQELALVDDRYSGVFSRVILLQFLVRSRAVHKGAPNNKWTIDLRDVFPIASFSILRFGLHGAFPLWIPWANEMGCSSRVHVKAPGTSKC